MPTTISGNDGVSQVQNNTITQSDLTTAVLPLGVGQSWINQTAVRSFGTTYTNDTGRPIIVSVSGITTSPTTTISLLVNGVPVSRFGTGGTGWTNTVQGVVPSGGTYSVPVTNTSLDFWSELR